LGGKATDATVAVISMIVGAGRIGDFGKIVDEVLARSASGRGELVAEVRSAVALTPEQQDRLAAALSAKTQGTVTVRNVVDPAVLGGVVTTIGDSVLDGSVRTRLTQLRDAF
jgi:F-type H+-transporting ATPase subunit delta